MACQRYVNEPGSDQKDCSYAGCNEVADSIGVEFLASRHEKSEKQGVVPPTEEINGEEGGVHVVLPATIVGN